MVRVVERCIQVVTQLGEARRYIQTQLLGSEGGGSDPLNQLRVLGFKFETQTGGSPPGWKCNAYVNFDGNQCKVRFRHLGFILKPRQGRVGSRRGI